MPKKTVNKQELSLGKILLKELPYYNFRGDLVQLPVPKFKIVLETIHAPNECWDCFGGRALIRNGCLITSVCR